MSKKKIRLMEVCGTHTMAIAHSGIKKALPRNIELLSGPGCPVCVTTEHDIDIAIKISQNKDVIVTTFGDMMRVPGTQGSIENIKTRGSDVRVVYSCLDALKVAKENPKKKVVFMGVGFETTSPTVAATILRAKKEGVHNFYVLSNFKCIFPALMVIATSKELNIDGFICPGHVSVITGSIPYKNIASRSGKPCVITGFDADDILKGIKRLLIQIKRKKSDVKIEYKRAVKKIGNREAMNVLGKVFEKKDADWRGIGLIKRSGLKFKKEYKDFDAEKKFKIKIIKKPKKSTLCICGDVIQGKRIPTDCKLFAKKCTPENPVGPCMISSEGSCAAYFKYGN